MKDWISLARKTASDTRRAQEPPPTPAVWAKLLKVESSTLITGTNYRYLYTVSEAVVRPAANSYVPTASSNTVTYDALSVSELSNGTSVYAYGVSATNIPTGFAPQSIPVGSWVLGIPHRRTDGTLMMLIVNTQAIDGDCP